MPVRSLLATSTRVAVQHVRYLTDVGNIPYSLARPFLVKIESPAQLREIEKNSPHIMEDDRELWMDFIKRDIPQWDQYDLPEEPTCWYDIYNDLVEQVQREVDEDALRLKRAVDKINSEKASNSAVFVQDTRLLPQPRRRGPTRTEPKKSSIFQSKRNKVLAVPTHRLNSGASQIRHVPQWLVDQHKQPSTAVQNQLNPAAIPKITSSKNQNNQVLDPLRSRKPLLRPPRVIQSASTHPAAVARPDATPASRSVPSKKRPLEQTPSRSPTSLHTSVVSPSPRSSSPLKPPPFVRKRPISNQANVFIQQKRKKP